ncbi:MAG: twin-arginine translocase TatA/TatE family subunit [Bacteroidetes bacterium]|nr:twin-arginine translocase TatA/TatE family subunit [Bacteroidota bacterium]MBV6461406.1 Sec-independent protein translocase protein TatA [Flavobacteriales bacterium]MCC7050950.1 twin-arginine translocase TatA/TatE family subunit [Bacteroidia bacterium]WKZ75193.1 MAG: twin-arginine translocase TatA/TatE family subunit [Vicingaceae bacterium]MCL4817469.1 twin-arginine translocase TatA/TatE family subunit [Flavobacteriales bacterium]
MNLSVLLGMIGPNQIIIILVIVVLLFGAKKIPELMKGVGKGIKDFKDATKGNDEESRNENNHDRKELP